MCNLGVPNSAKVMRPLLGIDGTAQPPIPYELPQWVAPYGLPLMGCLLWAAPMDSHNYGLPVFFSEHLQLMGAWSNIKA